MSTYDYWSALPNTNWTLKKALKKTPWFHTKLRGTTTTAFAELEGLIGTGEAKLQPGDKFNKEIGQQIAIGRALINLGLKHQNKWLLRSLTEEQVKAQRAAKHNLGKLSEDVSKIAVRPITKKITKPSQPKPENNFQPRESRGRIRQARG